MDRRQALRDVLQELGLGGQVRVGAPAPAGAAPTPTRDPRREVFGPDAWLRPLERSGEPRLIEVGGERSSGRTALACRLSAGATRRGELVGWVDTADALDPPSLARAGADLTRLLWARPLGVKEAFRATELLLKAGFVVVVIDLGGVEVRALQRLGSTPWSRLQRAAGARGGTVLILSRDTGAYPSTPKSVGAASVRRDLGIDVSVRAGSRADAPARPSAVGIGSFATLGLWVTRQRTLFDRGLFEGFESRAQVTRRRAGPSGDTTLLHLLHRRPESARTETA